MNPTCADRRMRIERYAARAAKRLPLFGPGRRQPKDDTARRCIGCDEPARIGCRGLSVGWGRETVAGTVVVLICPRCQ